MATLTNLVQISVTNTDALELDEFISIASDTIITIVETIEKHDPEGIIQIDFEGDIISIIAPGDKKYILNKHNNYRQIWLASPFSGPSHFSYIQKKWITYNNILLADLLTKEFSQFVEKIKFYL